MRTIISLVIITILVFSSITIGKSIYNQASKFREIYQAEDDLSNLTKENSKLKATLEKEKSNPALEKQARDKLGYQKEGDVLYVVGEEDKTAEDLEKEARKNWEEWYRLLFH